MTDHKLRRAADQGSIPGAFKAPGGWWDFDQAALDRWISDYAPVRRRKRKRKAPEKPE